MPYTLPTNVTSFLDLLTWSNEITSGYFGLIILVTLGMIIFLALKTQFTTERSLGASAAITMIISIFFRILGLINDYVLIVFVLVGAISLVWLVTSKTIEY